MLSHVVTRMPEPFVLGDLKVFTLPAAKDNLVWLLHCQVTGALVAVDGPDAVAVQAAEARLGQTLTGILTTHTHHDHIGLHKSLAGRLDRIKVIGEANSPIPGLNHPCEEGDVVHVGETPFQVWLTEGHIEGHLSYVCDGAVFCGDTLFAGGCGYLFQGQPETMYRSLLRLASLPGETRVCCAHEYTEDNLRFACLLEPNSEALRARIADTLSIRASGGCTVPSTIGLERATNPFLRPGSPALQERLAVRFGRAPATLLESFTMTREWKNLGEHTSINLSDFLPEEQS